MSKSAQERATTRYRSRLADRGIVRFELQALEADRDLIRTLARRLTEEGAKDDRLRRILRDAIGTGNTATGGLLTMLRRSPMVGTDLDLTRSREPGRKIDL